MSISPDEIDISPQGSDSATDLVLASLATLNRTMEGVRETLERREEMSPGIFKLGSAPRSTSLRFRVQWLVIVVSAAGAYPLIVGTAAVVTPQTAVADTIILPFPTTIDSGKDISIGGVAANIVDAFLIGFADKDKE